ncbi:hypothetical protein B0H14DRAFT_207511 [Mycena olivaceomarginata]|nr:hypothetical protein B0H14DRAFT_207511 [Mycena olivaceomarginata]
MRTSAKSSSTTAAGRHFLVPSPIFGRDAPLFLSRRETTRTGATDGLAWMTPLVSTLCNGLGLLSASGDFGGFLPAPFPLHPPYPFHPLLILFTVILSFQNPLNCTVCTFFTLMRATTIGCSVSPQYEVHHRRHVHRPRRPRCIAESAFVASPRATTSLSAVPFVPSRCAPSAPPTARLTTHVCCVALGPHNTIPLRSTTRAPGAHHPRPRSCPSFILPIRDTTPLRSITRMPSMRTGRSPSRHRLACTTIRLRT